MAGTAIILGTGEGLSAALARALFSAGYALHLASRDTSDLTDLQRETDATLHDADATDTDAVRGLIDAITHRLDVAVYNPSARVRGPLTDLDPEEVRHAVDVTALGAFRFGQAAARKMLLQEPLNNKRGTILFTGASAGVKGFPQSAPFAMGKFAQRGLAQSMSRELHPKGIHVAWINIDGGILWPSRSEPDNRPNSMLRPEAIAETYIHLINQHPSAWTSEVAVRPWVENF